MGGTGEDMEGFKKLARTAALNSLPYQNTATHTERAPNKPLVPLLLLPFSHSPGNAIPSPHTRLKCGSVVCLVLLLCAVQKNFFNKNIKFAYVAPRRWQRSKLSWQLAPSPSLSFSLRRPDVLGLPLVTCGRNCFCRRKW